MLVTNNLFRHPALLAKEAATVDEISGGRAILGLGSGWFEPEHRRFGFALPLAGERVARLAEAPSSSADCSIGSESRSPVVSTGSRMRSWIPRRSPVPAGPACRC